MNLKKTGGIIFLAIFLLAALGNLHAQELAERSMRRVGLFVGSNNGGRGRVMLRYAVSDARAVSKVFADMGGIQQNDNILLVEPTVADINRQLDILDRELASSRKKSQRTEMVFYYSGHSNEEELLLNRERYSYRDLRERINRMDTDMRIVILDSCSSGAITRAKGGVKAKPFLFDSSVSAEGYAFLTSSSANEASQESDRIESSFFTHSLIAGLRGAADMVGDGKVTLNEIYRFAYTETLASTETSVFGAQHPSYDIQISGSGDVVLTDITETSASLVIDAELTGRITIRDENDFLVAELTKVNQKPMELGLGPGVYRITIQRGNNFYRSEVKLREDTRTPLSMSNFSLIASASGDRNRGEDEQQSSNNASPSGINLYTFFFNRVYEPFRPPLIGFINIMYGTHNFFQAGFVNWNKKNFNGFQASFINTTGGNFNGLQAGYVNTTGRVFNGVQAGFVNTTGGNFTGLQAGFVNSIAGQTKGIQAAFINTATKEMSGAQFGFVNIASQEIKGFQFGFVNYAEKIEKGVPVGFISIVREGGYRSVEYNFSEFHPIGVGLKFGVEKFYTAIHVGFNPIEPMNFATGLGIGTILPLGKFFYFNLELISLSDLESVTITSYDRKNDVLTVSPNKTTSLLSFVPSLGLRLGKHFSIAAGPSFTWVNIVSGDFINRLGLGNDERIVTVSAVSKPLFALYSYDFNVFNSFVIGARASVKIHF